VQIAEYVGGRQQIVQHVGSARTEAELGVLLARARPLLEPSRQVALDLGVEPSPAVTPLLSAAQMTRQAELFGPGAPQAVEAARPAR
jgi:hypothetical protein